MKRLLACVALVVVSSAACLSSGEPVPPVVNDFLRALTSGDLRAAYDATQLEELLEFNPGASLSYEHFAAFWDAYPLERYEVSKVSRLDRRQAGSLDEKGTPFFVVDVTLIQSFGSSTQSFHVEGEVLPRVQMDPHYVIVAVPKGREVSLTVDGVPSAPRAANGFVTLVVLPGRHAITVGDAELTIETEPLAVVDGPARVDTNPNGLAYVALT